MKNQYPTFTMDAVRGADLIQRHKAGLVRTVRQIPRATPSGFDFLFRTRPRALGQQTPPEPVLIP